jgi:hypothetical protein
MSEHTWRVHETQTNIFGTVHTARKLASSPFLQLPHVCDVTHRHSFIEHGLHMIEEKKTADLFSLRGSEKIRNHRLERLHKYLQQLNSAYMLPISYAGKSWSETGAGISSQLYSVYLGEIRICLQIGLRIVLFCINTP